MEDKRIRKSKMHFRNALIELLNEKPFEKITVTEICKKADSSRITFYTHYNDKYGLAEEIFIEMFDVAIDEYNRLQSKNNPTCEAINGYYNMLDCIINLYDSHISFLSHTSAKENPYLYSMFYKSTLNLLIAYFNQHSDVIKTKYTSEQTAALLFNGLLGVIDTCYDSHMPKDKVRKTVSMMYKDLISSNLFIYKSDKKGVNRRRG